MLVPYWSAIVLMAPKSPRISLTDQSLIELWYIPIDVPELILEFVKSLIFKTFKTQMFCLLGSRNSLTIYKLQKNIFLCKVEQNLHSCVNFLPRGWIKHCWMLPLLVQNHPTTLRISKVAKDTIESLTTVLPALVLPQVVWSCSLETTRLAVVQDSSVNGSLVVIKFSHRVWPVLTRLAIIFCCIMQAVFVLSQHTLSVSFILTLVTK